MSLLATAVIETSNEPSLQCCDGVVIVQGQNIQQVLSNNCEIWHGSICGVMPDSDRVCIFGIDKPIEKYSYKRDGNKTTIQMDLAEGTGKFITYIDFMDISADEFDDIRTTQQDGIGRLTFYPFADKPFQKNRHVPLTYDRKIVELYMADWDDIEPGYLIPDMCDLPVQLVKRFNVHITNGEVLKTGFDKNSEHVRYGMLVKTTLPTLPN